MSPSPHVIALAAAFNAVKPDAHNLLKVTPATEVGKPANSADMRAIFRLSSPA